MLPAAGEGSRTAGIFFPGEYNVTELLSYRGNTLLQDWNGYAVGIGFRNISIKGGKLSFSTILDFSFNDSLPQAVDCRIMPYQNDARIEWRGIEAMKGRSSVKWMVSWSREDGTDEHHLVTDTCSCIIPSLEPGKEYTVEVRSFNNREFGKPATQSFRTGPVTSPYPYIYITPDMFRTGKETDLRVFNLPPDATYTHWYIKGKKLQSSSITPAEIGQMEITVGIGYNDGTYEKITKTVNVR